LALKADREAQLAKIKTLEENHLEYNTSAHDAGQLAHLMEQNECMKEENDKITKVKTPTQRFLTLMKAHN